MHNVFIVQHSISEFEKKREIAISDLVHMARCHHFTNELKSAVNIINVHIMSALYLFR